jgi:ubiquinone biosynthesis protein UbiJ
MRWAEAIANGSARLDPLTRTRLRALSGRVVDIELDPRGETLNLSFDGDAVHIASGRSDSPSVRVRGTVPAITAAFFGLPNSGASILVDGDEVVLEQIRMIAREYRPDVFPPLDALVGPEAAQAFAGFVEFGVSALGSLARGMRDEGARLAREGAKQAYLTRAEFDTFIASISDLRIRLDRLRVRADVVESASGGDDRG